jgi:hypothetical protein
MISPEAYATWHSCMHAGARSRARAQHTHTHRHMHTQTHARMQVRAAVGVFSWFEELGIWRGSASCRAVETARHAGVRTQRLHVQRHRPCMIAVACYALENWEERAGMWSRCQDARNGSIRGRSCAKNRFHRLCTRLPAGRR